MQKGTNEPPQPSPPPPPRDEELEELLDNESIDHQSVINKKVKHYKHLKYIRMVLLLIIWIIFTVLLFMAHDTDGNHYHGTVVPLTGKIWTLQEPPISDTLTIGLKGPFAQLYYDIVWGKRRGYFLEAFADKPEYSMLVQVQRTFKNAAGVQTTEMVSGEVELALMPSQYFDDLTKMRIEREKILSLKPSTEGGVYAVSLTLKNVDKPVPVEIKIYPMSTKTFWSRLLSGLIIAGMFSLFFWDAVSRGIIAILFCTLTIAVLGVYHHVEPLKDLLNYVDLDVILLIFGLTLIICILAETGGDIFLAVQFYRFSKGHIWPMLTIMCVAIAFGAAFLDSVTILILMTSLAIRLCEILQLNPTTVLTCLMLFSNTGNMLTQSGSAADSVMSQKGVIEASNIFRSYGYFLLHLLLPVLFSLGLTYGYLRLYYGSSEKMRIMQPPIVLRLRNAIRFWARSAQGVSGYTKDEVALQQNMFSKVERLRERLRRLGKMPVPTEDFHQKLQDLQEKHKIREPWLLGKCGIILLAVVCMQIAHSFRAHYLSPGWTCILFALMLLALANWHEFEALMHKIDWSTLVTLACLMIISRALQPLGLMDAVASSTLDMIDQVPESFRVSVASVVLLVMTTFSSIFMDSEYVSYVMSKQALIISRSPDFNVDLDPMLLAVFLGAGFGANATLVSSIANIVCSGIAEKHGFKFYFYDFFKVGIVVTLINIVMGIIYLLIFIAVMGFT